MKDAFSLLEKDLALYEYVERDILLRNGDADTKLTALVDRAYKASQEVSKMKLEQVPFRPLLQEIHECLMRVKHPSLRQIVNKVRGDLPALAKELGKPNPEFKLEGLNDWILSDTAAESIFTALGHMTRNVMDHGFNTSDQGKISFSFKKKVGYLSLMYASNEAGLHLEKLAKKAADVGYSYGSDEELAQLIFRPNVSTAAKVTQVSGRGVGMDAVKNVIQEIGGEVVIHFTSARTPEGRRPFCFEITIPESHLLLETGAENALSSAA
jgi:two-component system chemotaxis sensor kinase CheA